MIYENNILVRKTYQMNGVAERTAVQLRATRDRKGLSQRELSIASGVPQPHISRIERGGVDMRLSSLVAIAHALDLEIALVPRRAMPAVKSISRSMDETRVPGPRVRREFDRLAEAVREAGRTWKSPTATELFRRLQELRLYQSSVADPDELASVRKAITRARESGCPDSLDEAARQFRTLTDSLARVDRSDHVEIPRPAYRLDDDDE